MSRGCPLLMMLLLASTALVFRAHAWHFRGGTIGWKSEGGRKVRFLFRLGWMYNMRGPGCTENIVGEHVDGLFKQYWMCLKGCPTRTNLGDCNYYCSAASRDQEWEQGLDNFTYTFPDDGPFTVGYTNKGDSWDKLSHKNGSSEYHVATTVHLKVRSDTGEVNSSPVTLSKPVYQVKFGCEYRMHIPAVDPDGDIIRCRWATGKEECGGICNGLPGGYFLDEEKCILTFNASSDAGYIPSGTYAVAVMIEDYSPTHIGPMSSIPLQFMVKTTPDQPTIDCSLLAQFVDPTPKAMEGLVAQEGIPFRVNVYANIRGGTTAQAVDIRAVGPLFLTPSTVTSDVNDPKILNTTFTWMPSEEDIGNNIVCAVLEFENGLTGEQRCFSVKVDSPECLAAPCRSRGKCIATGPGRYYCMCKPGHTGRHCEHTITSTDATFTTTPTEIPTDITSTDATFTKIPTEIPTDTDITSTDATFTKKPKDIPTDIKTKEYGTCRCHVSQAEFSHKILEPWADLVGGMSRTSRDLLSFAFALPFGLALSVLTSTIYKILRQRQTKERRTSRVSPMPRPF